MIYTEYAFLVPLVRIVLSLSHQDKSSTQIGPVAVSAKFFKRTPKFNFEISLLLNAV